MEFDAQKHFWSVLKTVVQAFIWNIYFCNKMKVFIFILDQFNAALLNKSINLKKKKKKKILMTPNIWMVVAVHVLQGGCKFLEKGIIK